MPKIFKFFDLNEHRNLLKKRQDSLHTETKQEVSQINKNIPFYKTQDVMTNKFEHSNFFKIVQNSFTTQERQRASQREKEMNVGLLIGIDRTGTLEFEKTVGRSFRENTRR